MDIVLTVMLAVVFPAYTVWLSQRPRIDSSKKRGVGRTLWIAYSFLLALATIWIVEHRSLSELGLEWPLSRTSLVLLGISALLLGALALWTRLAIPQSAQSTVLDNILPKNAPETIRYVFAMLSLGVIWEVLYRGYLIWSLELFFGLWPAVTISAMAYGLAHGIKSRKQIIGSLVSAIVFASAYGLTHSLWWLILIHCALPLMPLLAKRQTQAEAHAFQDKG